MYHDTIDLQKLQEKKNRGLSLASSFMRLGWEDKALLLMECGTYLGFAETTEGRTAIVEANFCKQRLCPACNWRRSLKIYGNTSRILDYIDETEGKAVKYLFLTLTVRNVPLERLGEQLDAMAAGFKRLTNNRAWQRRVKGCMRTLEVTINHETMEAHPHYHLILAVARKYATKGDATYWDHSQWVAAWRQAARLDYEPNVSIERVRGRRSGVAEVSKYMAKDTDYIITAWEASMGTEEAEAATDRIVRALAVHLKGRRLIAYTGLLRQAQQALRIRDPETGDLTDDIRGDVVSAIRHYHWHAGLGAYRPTKED